VKAAVSFFSALLILVIWIIIGTQSISFLRKKALMNLFEFILVYITNFLNAELIIRMRIINDSIASLLFINDSHK